jgi:hypothetical protein
MQPGLPIVPLLLLALAVPPVWSEGFDLDTSRRESVRNFYNALYPASSGIAIGWSGDAARCLAGDTGAAYKEAVRLRVNFFRALAGVPAAIVFDSEYNRKAQEMALMIAANRDVSHLPPSSWLCYSADGAEAGAKSNLALGSAGPDAVTGYIEDRYANNYTVGHRRWLLYPQTRVMGTGDVLTADYTGANSLWVHDDAHYWDSRPPVRDQFVAWPPPGYVPYPLVFARWSFSYPGADFSQASVGMSHQGQPLSLEMEAQEQGYGENSVVWVPALDLPAAVSQDSAYQVSLRNVRINGVAQAFDYTVTVFDPARAGADTVWPSISGPAQAEVGQINRYSFVAVPGAEGYQWQQARRAPALGNGAEDGLAGVIDGTESSYALINRELKANGEASFHLAHPVPREQFFTLAPVFLAGPQAAVSFASRLGWASENQIAMLQVSLDNGQSWQTVYRQAGDNGRGDTGFSRKHLSLAAYAGLSLRLRFSYVAELGGLFYPQSDAGVGWHVDDIAFEGMETLSDSRISRTETSGFSFVPPTSGGYILQARALLYGQYPLEWGPAFPVEAEGERYVVDRVFDWGQQQFPRNLDASAGTQAGNALGYYYRYYPASNTYVGEKDGRVYYFAPAVSPHITDVGALADFLRQAEAAGF